MEDENIANKEITKKKNRISPRWQRNENLDGKRHLRDVDLDERIILK
jgi:hypothetical protein